MVTTQHIRRHVSPVLLVGALSVSIVMGVSVLKFASAAQPQTAASQAVKLGVGESLNPGTVTSGQSDVAISSDSALSSEGSTGESQQNLSQGSVTVNGQTYTVPGNGELHTTTSDANGQTSVNISVHSSGNGQNSSSSSNVHVFSNSSNASQSNGSTKP